MPVSAETLRALIAAGVNGDALIGVVEMIDADMKAAIPTEKQRTPGALRQARYREKLAAGDVTQSDVTPSLDPQEKEGPHTPKKTQPPSSLRSERSRARVEQFSEFRAAYPRKPGAPWQPALEKFCRLVRDGENPETIIEGARRYAAARAGEDPQFTCAPLVFLNQHRWKDDHQPAVPKGINGARAGPGRPPERRNTAISAAQDLISEWER